MNDFHTAEVIFFISLALTFGAALFARFRAEPMGGDEDLAGRRLNRWLVGLSAGTTANSGFIVTAAVGLGYSGGLHWVLLPLSWMLGDLFFWAIFPERLNRLAREGKATTLSELLTFDLSGFAAKLISVFVSVLLVTFLATYTAAQWLAGKKFLAGVFDLDAKHALAFFALTIILYSSLGGFRGSVYTDVVQAIIRMTGTLIAIIAVSWSAYKNTPEFSYNISSAGEDFLYFFPNGTFITAGGFIIGYACASVGFGLGQPQIVSRYLAGSSPLETRKAKWIYIGFVQFTWIAMTCFGILLRGVMPGIEDPETGLSLFFQKNIGAIATGIILADVYATIAATSNGILVAITQTLQRDLISKIPWLTVITNGQRTLITIFVGFVTIILSLVLPGNVFSIAIDSVSKIGSGLAGPVMIKALGWRHSSVSLLCSMLAGIGMAFLWKWLGYDSILNEASVGLASSLTVNWIVKFAFQSAMPEQCREKL